MGVITFDDMRASPATVAGPNTGPITFEDAVPKNSVPTHMAVDFGNVQSGASQRTSPHVTDYKSPISSDVFQGDDGTVLYRDQNGAVVPTDQSKQIALRDPSDNKIKIYNRSEGTNENPVVGLSRVLTQGMVTSQPGMVTRGVVAARPAVPTSEELKAAYRATVNSPEIKSATVPMTDVRDLAAAAESDLVNKGFRPTTGSAPSTFAEIQRLTPKAQQPSAMERLQAEMNWQQPAAEVPAATEATVPDLLAARRAFGQVSKQRDPITGPTPDAAAASDVGRKLDAVIEKSAPQMAEANANYSAAKHADLIDQKAITAELRAAAANSGRNVANTMRQRMADVLINPRLKRGFSEDQLAQMEEIVRGTTTQNVLRAAGNALGGGGGAHSFYSGLLTLGVAPATGFVLKKIGDGMTLRQVAQLSENIRANAPLGKAIENAARDWQAAHDAMIATPNYSKFSALSLASRNLSNNLASAGVELSPRQLLHSLQGPVDASANGDQPAVPRSPGE